MVSSAALGTKLVPVSQLKQYRFRLLRIVFARREGGAVLGPSQREREKERFRRGQKNKKMNSRTLTPLKCQRSSKFQNGCPPEKDCVNVT